MTYGLNLARLNLGVALRGNLNALWIDVAIASRTTPTKLPKPPSRDAPDQQA